MVQGVSYVQTSGLVVYIRNIIPAGASLLRRRPWPIGVGLRQPRMWCAGPAEMEGGTLSDRLGDHLCKTYSNGGIVSVASDT